MYFGWGRQFKINPKLISNAFYLTSILKQCFRSVLSVDDVNKLVQYNCYKGPHFWP